MSHRSLVTAAAACFVLIGSCGAVGAKRVPLDATLYTFYSGGGPYIQYSVCGSIPQSEGCYGGDRLEPFEQACAVLEGTPRRKGNVITRAIYVLDKRSSNIAPITLTIFARTDTITDQDDQIEVTLTKVVPLGLVGGRKATCSMAANDAFVYAATSADAALVTIDKTDLTATTLAQQDQSDTVVSITADDRGYVAVHYQHDFVVYNPNGIGQIGGGGAGDMVSTRNSWTPK